MFVVILVVLGVLALTLFYKDFKTIEKLTKEIGELSADKEMLEIDLEGEKMFIGMYQSFLNSSYTREIHLTEELEKLQQKNVKSKKAVKKDKIKTETKTKK